MPPPEVLSIAALLISLAGFGSSAYFGFRDRARVIARSEYFPPIEDEPSRLRVTVVNAGRRPVILHMLVSAENNKKWVGTYLGKPDKPLRLGEFERWEHTITRDDLLEQAPDGEVVVADFWFEDTLNRKHRVAGAKKNIARLRLGGSGA